jgi:hypothetical protein
MKRIWFAGALILALVAAAVAVWGQSGEYTLTCYMDKGRVGWLCPTTLPVRNMEKEWGLSGSTQQPIPNPPKELSGCPDGKEPGVIVGFDGKGGYTIGSYKCLPKYIPPAKEPAPLKRCEPRVHRWVSELSNSVDSDGGHWSNVGGQGYGTAPKLPTIERYQVGGLNDGQRTTYQLDWCLDHDPPHFRTLRSGPPSAVKRP